MAQVSPLGQQPFWKNKQTLNLEESREANYDINRWSRYWSAGLKS